MIGGFAEEDDSDSRFLAVLRSSAEVYTTRELGSGTLDEECGN